MPNGVLDVCFFFFFGKLDVCYFERHPVEFGELSCSSQCGV